MAQKLQLKTVGLLRQNVPMKPAEGSKLRKQVMEILGDRFQEWIDESE